LVEHVTENHGVGGSIPPLAIPGSPRGRQSRQFDTPTDFPPSGEADLTIFTHVLVTTVGVKLLHLSGGDVALAYGFGCAVDIDHLIKAPFYYKAIGLKDKRGYYWRSSLQEPVAFLWILPLCFFLGTWVPAIFFAAHLALDYAVRYEKMPFYPYSKWVTCGWNSGPSDKVKEIFVFIPALCLTVFLFVRK
jgi:hypothetical protein